MYRFHLHVDTDRIKRSAPLVVYPTTLLWVLESRLPTVTVLWKKYVTEARGRLLLYEPTEILEVSTIFR